MFVGARARVCVCCRHSWLPIWSSSSKYHWTDPNYNDVNKTLEYNERIQRGRRSFGSSPPPPPPPPSLLTSSTSSAQHFSNEDRKQRFKIWNLTYEVASSSSSCTCTRTTTTTTTWLLISLILLTFFFHANLEAPPQPARLTVLALGSVNFALVVVEAHEVLRVLDASPASCVSVVQVFMYV